MASSLAGGVSAGDTKGLVIKREAVEEDAEVCPTPTDATHTSPSQQVVSFDQDSNNNHVLADDQELRLEEESTNAQEQELLLRATNKRSSKMSESSASVADVKGEVVSGATGSVVVVSATVHRCPLCPFLTESVTEFCRHMCIHTDTSATPSAGNAYVTTTTDGNGVVNEVIHISANSAPNVNPIHVQPITIVSAADLPSVAAQTISKSEDASVTGSDAQHLILSSNTCCVCGEAFSNSDDLQNHLRLHTTESRLVACSACGLVFTERDQLEAHLATHTSNETGNLCWVYTTTGDMDGAATTGDGTIAPNSVVVLTAAAAAPLVAQAAAAAAGNARAVTNACASAAATQVVVGTAAGPTTVTADGTVATNDTSNADSVDKSRPFACTTCGKTFSQKVHLDNHLRIHTGERPFQCSVCSKSFSRKEHMGRHMRTHTGERPFGCFTCQKRFSRKVHLESHVRVHTGERPYGCSVCGKAFGRREHIERHVRIHTGERAFMCASCGRAFSQKVHLENHARVHTGERPFQCLACGKSFRRREYMKRHMRAHTGERPFHCGQCGKSFRQKSHVDRHVRTHQIAAAAALSNASGEQTENANDADAANVDQAVTTTSVKSTGDTSTMINTNVSTVSDGSDQKMEQGTDGQQQQQMQQRIDSAVPATIATAEDKMKLVDIILTCSTCGKSSMNHDEFQQHLRTHMDGTGATGADEATATTTIQVPTGTGFTQVTLVEIQPTDGGAPQTAFLQTTPGGESIVVTADGQFAHALHLDAVHMVQQATNAGAASSAGDEVISAPLHVTTQ